MFYVFLVVWVTCPVHRSLRLLPLPPSLSPNIALWLHEVGDSNAPPPSLHSSTHTHSVTYPVILSPFPGSACLPVPALSSHFLHGRAAERGPSPPDLPSAASFPLSHGWVPDLPQPPHQCLHERLRTREKADPDSMPSGTSLLPSHCFLAVWHRTAFGTELWHSSHPRLLNPSRCPALLSRVSWA